MSTALFKLYESPGFVLGADGLKQKIEDDGAITTETFSCQKIFPIRQPDKALAYSLTGTVQLGGETSEGAGFDFAARTRDAVEAMANRNASDLKAYVTEVCASLEGLLNEAKKNGRVESYPAAEVQWEGETGDTIVEILFDGYYRGTPSSVRARFFHDNQVFAPPEIVDEPNVEGGMRIDGSANIANGLFKTDEPLFDIYRKSWTSDSPLLLAIQKAKSYFRACADPEVRKLDERACAKDRRPYSHCHNKSAAGLSVGRRIRTEGMKAPRCGVQHPSDSGACYG
jgi:hypothetical protein